MSKDTVSEDFLQDWKTDQQVAKAKEVTCLGLSFPNEDARREHFTKRLAEKLKDPEFRAIDGFPQADDETILRLSDPPYYCACPNPFLEEVIEHHGKPYDPAQPYYRPPFAVDASEGKADQLYQAHAYHTKVPHLAIVPCILHYTDPGDIVVDGFCGSGMTGVAAQWCGCPTEAERHEIEARFKKEDLPAPKWGARRAIINDLSPAASFIAGNMNIPIDAKVFEEASRRLLNKAAEEIGWMYETKIASGQTAQIEYTLWGEMFSCPECGNEVDFVKDAIDPKSKRVNKTFPCSSCSAELNKDRLCRVMESKVDKATGEVIKQIKFRPIVHAYKDGRTLCYKEVDESDLDKLERIAALPIPPEAPTVPFPIKTMYHGSRLAPKGFTSAHHLFLPRALQALCCLWRLASAESNPRLRNMLLFFVEQAIWTTSILNRFQPQGFKQVNKYLPGVYYVPSQTCEVSPWYAIKSRGTRLSKTFDKFKAKLDQCFTNAGSATVLGMPSNCVDYIYTDPPFGENIFYADLNFLVESWHGVTTASAPEAIVDRHKGKALPEYLDLMHRCFAEYFRVLKPGRWMTMVFSNSKNAVWIAIQEALSRAGFIVADVRSLDKELGSYRQVTSTAVKQDLVVTCYKANGGLEDRFGGLEDGTEAGAWDFVRTHLKHVPVVLGKDELMQSIQERTAYALYDRMTAFHVQRQRRVPLSAAEFRAGLEHHFAERDGMYFLPEQVAAYDRKRLQAKEVEQLHLMVTDEASAIRWLRQELRQRPRSIQDLFNDFKKQLTSSWPKHEATPELKTLLNDNFLQYQGSGAVPSQIHAYLSTNYKDHRGQAKDNPALMARASGRWYVPDPKQQADVDQLREKRLLKEFQHLVEDPARKLKTFRLEAVRAGFKDAWQRQDYQTIVRIAEKIPDKILQEDDKLLMYYDQAQTRLGDD